MCVKIFHFKSVYFEQPVSENSVFRTTYIHKQTAKTMMFSNAFYLQHSFFGRKMLN